MFLRVVPTNRGGRAYLESSLLYLYLSLSLVYSTVQYCTVSNVEVVARIKAESSEQDPRKAYAVYNRVAGRASGSPFGKIVPALSSSSPVPQSYIWFVESGWFGTHDMDVMYVDAVGGWGFTVELRQGKNV